MIFFFIPFQRYSWWDGGCIFFCWANWFGLEKQVKLELRLVFSGPNLYQSSSEWAFCLNFSTSPAQPFAEMTQTFTCV